MKKILFLAIALVMSVCGAWADFTAGVYTIKPYSDQTKYVVPSKTWAATGANMAAYSTDAFEWNIKVSDDSQGYTISRASDKGVSGDIGYLNPWNNSTEGAIGCWKTNNGDDRWTLTEVANHSGVYTIKGVGKTCYMYYKDTESLLYYNNPSTPGETNWFVLEKISHFPDAGTYYLTFKGKDSGRHQYLYNDLTQADGYTLITSTQGTTNAYIWRAVCDGEKMTTIKNGQGQTIGMYGKYNNPAGTFTANALTYTSHSDCYYLKPYGSTNMKSSHDCLNQPNDNYYKNAAGTFTLTSWSTTSGADAADNHWYVTEVTDKDFYNVVITDGVAAQEFNYRVASYATYSGQNAANGGFFAVAKGTTIANSDVTVTNLPAGKQAVVEVNDHTINITFVVSHSTEEIEALQQKINAALTNIENGVVGYPDKENADNQTAINTLKNSPAVTNDNFDTSLAAYTAVCKLQNAVLPVVGKAYKVAFLKANGTKMYVSKKDVTGNVTANAEDAALFVLGNSVEYTGGPGTKFKYILVDQDARFLAANGTNEAYGGKTGFAIVKGAQYTDNSNFASYTNEQNLACFSFVFADLTDGNGGGWYQIGLNADDEISTHYDYWTTTTATTALALEEFDNPNTYKLICRHEGGTASLDGKCVGTFSAPYNVELPSGIKAYVAESRDDLIINLTKLGEEGNIVPKNTGVLLYSEGSSADINPAVALPATSTISYEGSNMFQPTMEGVTVDAEVKAYILADAYDHVQFYRLADEERTIARNKAYLELPTSVYSISTFRFDFEDGLTTAISQLSAQNSKHAAFDLAGRRVNAAVKGISIVNGKKFIK